MGDGFPVEHTSGDLKELDPFTPSPMTTRYRPPALPRNVKARVIHSLPTMTWCQTLRIRPVESLVSLASQSSPGSQAKTSGLNGKRRKQKTLSRRRSIPLPVGDTSGDLKELAPSTFK